MANISRGGVCYKVSESPFFCDCGDYRFYFSSYSHLQKFIEKVRGRELWLSDSFSRRFHCDVDASVLAVFQLYNQVESRGFCVIDAWGREYDSMASMRFKVDLRDGD